MNGLMARSARHWFVIKAARQIRKEIEQAGLDNLKILVEADKSLVGTYLQGCSSQEKANYRRDFNALLQMGITIDMVLEEVARQLPDIAPIIESKPDYKKTEIREIERFLREG